jgi:dienelactone hydrolase
MDRPTRRKKMFSPRIKPAVIIAALSLTISTSVSLMTTSALAVSPQAQTQRAANFKAPDTIDFRTANIMSEGVRLHAELLSLKTLAGKQLPTVIMAHGWGGTAANFRRDALDLAAAGYFVIVFDYRGWGESDSRVILTGPAPAKKEGLKFTAEVLEVREVVDPLENVIDWFNVIHWAMAEPMVDKNRIGLRGSSYSGGHVLYVAARDPRVKAIVSQVGSLDSRPKAVAIAGGVSDQVKLAYEEATKRARGEIGYPAPRARVIGNLQGGPVRDKLLLYAPVEDAATLKNCAALFIVAEKEELFDNKDHAKLAYDRIPGANKKYISVPGITHYGIYTTARDQAIKAAIEWFDQYLKK